MNLNTSISIAFLFSSVTMVANIVAIYFSVKKNNDSVVEKDTKDLKEEFAKDLKNVENFTKIGAKLDNLSQNLHDIQKSTDKTTEVLNSLQNHISEVDSKIGNQREILKNHEERLQRLERKDA